MSDAVSPNLRSRNWSALSACRWQTRPMLEDIHEQTQQTGQISWSTSLCFFLICVQGDWFCLFLQAKLTQRKHLSLSTYRAPISRWLFSLHEINYAGESSNAAAVCSFSWSNIKWFSDWTILNHTFVSWKQWTLKTRQIKKLLLSWHLSQSAVKSRKGPTIAIIPRCTQLVERESRLELTSSYVSYVIELAGASQDQAGHKSNTPPLCAHPWWSVLCWSDSSQPILQAGSCTT